MTLQNLVCIADLSDADISTLLNRADSFAEAQPRRGDLGAHPETCVQLLFYEDSTRTRTSFESAAARLGYSTCLVTASGSSVAKGESLRDTVMTLQASVEPNVLVLRHPENLAPAHVASAPWCTTAVVNAGDGINEHPTQALLDAFTLQRHFGVRRLDGVRIVIVGDIVRSRVARSNVALLPRLGAQVTVVAPQEMLPDDIQSWGVTAVTDLDDVIADVDVVMMLRIQKERMASATSLDLGQFHNSYGLTDIRASRMRATSVVMHPGPMNRGVEIADDVADGPRSLIVQQVRNGVWLRMAVLESLAGAHG